MKVMLAGPIKAWWDLWGTPPHKTYVAWRSLLAKVLIERGHLVYLPHEAWKGDWDESAQMVNDMVVYTSDVVINLSPPGIPSEGTDREMTLCDYVGRRVVSAPPPGTNLFAEALGHTLRVAAEVESVL